MFAYVGELNLNSFSVSYCLRKALVGSQLMSRRYGCGSLERNRSQFE